MSKSVQKRSKASKKQIGRPFPSISVSFRPFPSIQHPFASISVQFRPFASISGHFRPFPSTRVHLHPFPSTYVHLRPFASISVHFRPLTSILVHLRPFPSAKGDDSVAEDFVRRWHDDLMQTVSVRSMSFLSDPDVNRSVLDKTRVREWSRAATVIDDLAS